MSDILFRYLLMAQRREGSRARHLLFAREGLLTAGVEQLVESAVSRVDVRSQHEGMSHRQVETPASRRHHQTFHIKAQPARPTAPHFSENTQSFPLQNTLRVFSCGTCAGSGKVRCQRCSGDGEVRCGSCGGDGTRGSGADKKRCSSCGGSGCKRCSRCSGSGQVSCDRCSGEGRLASWTIEVYEYTIQDQRSDGYPIEEPSWRLKRATGRWLAGERATVPAFSTSVVEASLGYTNPSVARVARQAEATRLAHERHAHTSPGTCLFLHTDRYIEPLGYTVLRLGRSPRWYWLVGRGVQAEEVAPIQAPSPLRLAVGLLLLGGLGLTGLLAHAAWLYGFAWFPASWLLFVALFGCIAASLALGWALSKLSGQDNPVRTVVIARQSGQPSAFLPVVASMGSHVGALHVTDRNYTVMMDALLGKARDDRQSSSLFVHTCDGLRVRFVELAGGGGSLSDDQCAAVMHAVDAVVFLGDKDDGLAALKQRMEAVDRPRARFVDIAVREGDSWRDGELPLSFMQDAFITAQWDNARWHIAFRDLWSQLAPALRAPAPDPAPPPALTGPASMLPVPSPRPPSMRRLLEFLFPRRQQTCKIPILGVEGSGKSSLIVTLGQYVSLHEHGCIPESSQAVFGAYLPYVMKGKPLRATVRHSAFSVELSRIPEKDGGLTQVDLSLSSEDIPGQDFRMLVNELTRNPDLTPGNDGAGAIVKRFGELLSDCDGFIFVVDLMRNCSPKQFAADPRKQVWAAYSDQVKPIMTGILLAARHNATLAHKPMFFVFSKPDQHAMSTDQLEEDFRRAMAIPLGALRALDVRTRLYSVQCAGWGMDSNLDNLGIDILLSDLAHSVGAVRRKD